MSFFLNFYEDYHTVIPFQHTRSTKQAKHETKNKQKATKIQKLKHLAISIEIKSS
jgi:hypothetical protein